MKYLVMFREVVVGNGYESGSVDNIKKTIGAASQITVIDPNIRRCKNSDAITITTFSLLRLPGDLRSMPGLAGLQS